MFWSILAILLVLWILGFLGHLPMLPVAIPQTMIPTAISVSPAMKPDETTTVKRSASLGLAFSNSHASTAPKNMEKLLANGTVIAMPTPLTLATSPAIVTRNGSPKFTTGADGDVNVTVPKPTDGVCPGFG